MTTTKWLAAGAFLAAVTASPALARDGSAAREGTRHAVERTTVAGSTRSPPVTKRADDKGRPCCVMHGKTAYDHLRG